MADIKDYKFLPALFLRAPHYSFTGYDLNRLPAVLRQQDFLNAIWLASPGFYRVLEKNNFSYERLAPRQQHTLLKYYNRICFRPTPFGSFASFSLLQWGAGDPVRLPAASGGTLHLLPDQQLMERVNHLAPREYFNDRLVVNPCLYLSQDVFRYVKSAVQPDGRYTFTLEAMEAAGFNAGLVAMIGTGDINEESALAWICRHGECTLADAQDYLAFLIQEQVLLTSRAGNVIRSDHRNGISTPFAEWRQYWDRHEACSLTNLFPLTDASAELAGMLPPAYTAGLSQFFYAAVEKRVESGGPAVTDQDKLLGAVEVLSLLSSVQQPEDLAAFISEFTARYDQEKIPLLLALDTDTGITYGNLLAPEPDNDPFHSISFPEDIRPGTLLEWSPVHQLLFRRWMGDSLRDPWSPLVIREEDINELKNKSMTGQTLAQTQALMYRNTGEHLLMEYAGGVTATALIGRFSCFSEAVHHLSRELAVTEAAANPDVVFADIGQLSDTHTDNINRRKPVYDYEIPVNVVSVQPVAMQIPPADLLVSVQNGELILESIRLGKRVIPRLATAYNFRHHALPVFRLLGDLQYQSINTLFSFDLEVYFPEIAYYPRVCTREVVISLARWTFTATELDMLFTVSQAEALLLLNEFRRFHHLPRHISLGATDQQLVFDLAVAAEATFFLECIRGLKKVIIREYLYPDRSVMSGNKPLAGQFIAFLSHPDQIYNGIRHQNMNMPADIPRRFMAGSDWLYLKVFCSSRVADIILTKVFLPLLKDYGGWIKKWFFIRYTQGGYHLRVRLYAEETDLAKILPELHKRMSAGGYDKMIRNFQVDTYEREMERYSALLIADVEDLFHCGSELAAWYVQEVAAGTMARDNFQFGLFTAERMIHAFFNGVEGEMLGFTRDVSAGFLNEFKADKKLRVALDQQYRQWRPVMATLWSDIEEPQLMELMLGKVRNLAKLTREYPITEKIALLADAVHMQLNRTFTVQHRQQEMLVYYYLDKYLTSRIARRIIKA